MAIPYLGSKRKSAGQIYSTIRNLEPNADTVVDLFCGGFAISEYFYKRGWRVIANDKNRYVIALLRKLIFEGLDESIVTGFVSRSEFLEVVNSPENYDDWYVGFVMCNWSFGNNQADYLFGKDTEPIKRAGHELVINRDPLPLKSIMPSIPKKHIDGILRQVNWHKRRLALAMVSRKLKTRTLELQQLQQLQQLQRLERLQQLQQLEQLERLQQLERLELLSTDYRDVAIPEGAVVYCDPPYKGTTEYREGGFNHDEFWEWAREVSKTNPIYISEYSTPDDFKIVLSFSQNSTLAGGQNKGQPRECLFTIISNE